MALKAVGKAIRNSPRAIRKKFGHVSPSEHEKLDEDWYHSQDPVTSGVIFYVKYLGSTSVSKTHGPGSTDDAVKRIVQDAKHRGGKLQKVEMTVSAKYIRLVDVGQKLKLDELPLYRVSYCTVDPYYDKVFCYISRDSETKKLECHAFLCTKKSKAEAITLTVAQAFNIAFEKWQATKARRAAREKAAKEAQPEKAAKEAQPEQASNGQLPTSTGERDSVAVGDLLTSPEKKPSSPSPPATKSPARSRSQSPHPLATSRSPVHSPQPIPPPPQHHTPPPSTQGAENLQIDVTPTTPLQTPGVTVVTTTMTPTAGGATRSANPFASADDSHPLVDGRLLSVKSTIPKALSLDYLSLEDNFDAEFTRLAEARSNPHLLAIGDHLNRTSMQDDVLELMQGERTAEDLDRSKSHEDLLML